MYLFFTISHSKTYSAKYDQFVSFLCPHRKGFLYFCAPFFKENDPQKNRTSAYHLKTTKIIYHDTTKMNHTTQDKSYRSTNKQR